MKENTNLLHAIKSQIYNVLRVFFVKLFVTSYITFFTSGILLDNIWL